MIKRLLAIFSLGFMLFINSSRAINVSIPNDHAQPDVAVLGSTYIERSEGNLFNVIAGINSYLRFSIGVICLGALVYGGFGLITSQGNDDKMKRSNKILMGALVGILISILSYAVVRLVVNLL